MVSPFFAGIKDYKPDGTCTLEPEQGNSTSLDRAGSVEIRRWML